LADGALDDWRRAMIIIEGARITRLTKIAGKGFDWEAHGQMACVMLVYY
jgi:hypothetical protein